MQFADESFYAMNASDVLSMSERIIAAYIASNPTTVDDMPRLIESVHASVAKICQSTASSITANEVKTCVASAPPAVPIEDSVNGDYLVCLEDGERYRSLKRHLLKQHQMTPDQYRKKWGLPPEYPMVSPNYSIEASELAKKTAIRRRV